MQSNGTIVTPPWMQRTSQHAWEYLTPGPKSECYFHTRWLTESPAAGPRCYVPILWTHVYWDVRDDRRLRKIQGLLNKLRGRKTFTVVQHDLGIWKHRVPKDMLVFGAGGRGDIPIPLLYHIPLSDHPVNREKHFAYFAGEIARQPSRNFVRHKMQHDLLGHGPDFTVIDTAQYPEQYVPARQHMRECTFALCPRGHGKTSYRLYEAMHYGAIPVVIFDRPWLPYQEELDWDEFTVQCHVDDVAELPQRLKKYSPMQIQDMQGKIADLVPQYFTLESMYAWILRYLRHEQI